MLRKNTIPYPFILCVLLFLLADFTINSINHRFLMPDFKVYYGAAHAITSGKQVYGTLFSLGSGYYKYAPFIAFVFYPLSMLPYYAACVVYYVFISTAIVFTSILLLHLFNIYIFKHPVKLPALVLSISVLCIIVHLVRELELGNINMLLLLFLSLSVYFTIQHKAIPAGILLALVLITKPFFIVLLIPLVMRRYFKTALAAIVFLGAFIILPALPLGINATVELHREWLNAMLAHAGSYPSSNTIESIIRNDFSLHISDNFQYIVMTFFFILYMYYVGRNIINERTDQQQSTSHLVMEWFILIAMLPCLLKTDTEHFLLAMPIIVFILIYLFNTRNIPLTVCFIILILLYTGNSSDILGKDLSMRMYNAGVLGISNVLLIVLAFFIYTQKTFIVENNK